MKIDLKGLAPVELRLFVQTMNEPAYRGSQIAAWLYLRGVNSFEDMTDLSKILRQRLENNAVIGHIKHVKETSTTAGDSRKYLFQLEDGETIETVFIKLGTSQSLCLSTQVGCPMACVFCATGGIGFKRNLTAGEIVDQFLKVREGLQQNERITNIVFMGMGEPLLNLENVAKSIAIFTSKEGPAFSPRRITVSTCGITAGIHEMIKRELKPELAISIIAADEEKRAGLFPKAARYPLDEIIQASRAYEHHIRRPVTFEYTLIKDVNDTKADAAALGKLIRGVSCKINLIRYNAAPGARFQASLPERAKQFQSWLKPFCRMVTIRVSKGEEIQAACGQLRAGYAKDSG